MTIDEVHAPTREFFAPGWVLTSLVTLAWIYVAVAMLPAMCS